MARSTDARQTPVMRQFATAKEAYPDAFLFFRMGDFYELFEDDAVRVAPLLDIALTSRNRGNPDEIPMAGVPHHAAHSYIAKLLELGHKVAICEQMADPSKVKGLVPRQVVRVLTPGLVTHEEQLDSATNNWLAVVDVTGGTAGVASLDLSTGELRAAELADVTSALSELARTRPREILVAAADDSVVRSARALVPTAAVREDEPIDDAGANDALGALAGDARKLGGSARVAVARALRFARACMLGTELPIRRIGSWDPSAALEIDAVAQAHLELVLSASGRHEATLLAVIDETRTPAGARLLRRRLLAPLVDVAHIRRRQDAVETFAIHAAVRSRLRDALGGVGDLPRRVMRAELGEATPRDLGALRDGLAAAHTAVGALETLETLDRERGVLGMPARPGAVDALADLHELLCRALVDAPPTRVGDGAIFRDAFDARLAEITALRKNGQEQLSALEQRLRADAGIAKLKVQFTRVFGWYVEVPRKNAGKAPPEWRRKQTVASGERYATDELDDLADRILHAEDQHREVEARLFGDLVAEVARAADRVGALSALLARWDVAAALAEVAGRYDFVRPTVDDSHVIEITDGRHPVVERLAAAGRFVPNDVRLDIDGERLLVITGPNMAGKSTLLRQVALIVILAQMGSFVPARSATIGVADRVLSRVGASDDLTRGESTFMVEMRETAQILRTATPRSLVILDEIGRGTSTFDGLAIAWAVAEHLDGAIGCRAMFATHYHELTALAAESNHVANYSVAAREFEEDVVFLHRLVPGPASRSYGVAVAKLAGLPESVLARARAVLGTLESSGGSRGTGKPSPQLDLFAPKQSLRPTEDEVVRTLREVDVDRLTPLDALALLARLKKKL